MRELFNRLRDWFHRDQLDRELRDELAFHRAMLVRDADPASTADERGRLARRQLGNLTAVHEASRDYWGVAWLERLIHDVRHALRGLRKTPGFAAAVILTLGLGVGANALMFGIVDRLMFRPFAYLRDPASVDRIYLQSVDRNEMTTSPNGIEYTRYLDFRANARTISDLAAFTTVDLAVGSGDASRERRVGAVSASFFSFFTAQPVAGRFFVAADDKTPHGQAVVVLDYDFWHAEFGGRDVIGRTLQVGPLLYTIIGIAPKRFAGVDEINPPIAYIPITSYAAVTQGTVADLRNDGFFTTYDWGWLSIMVRRRASISARQASADLTRAYILSWEKQRAVDPGLAPASVAKPVAIAAALKVGSGPDPSLESRTALWITGVAIIVLLIACANVTNLFLARGMRRRRETAVRLALGVTRRRLLWQSVVEACTLATLASIIGVVIAQWGGALVRTLFLEGSTLQDVVADRRTLMLTAVVTVVVGLITGIIPFFLLDRGDLAGALKAGVRAGTHTRSRLRGTLLVIQGALSVMLLVGAGLFVRSLRAAESMGLGFDPDPVLVAIPHARGTQLDDSSKATFERGLLAAAAAIPGANHVAWVGSVPFYRRASASLYVAGIDSVRRLGDFTYTAATPDYFATMSMRIVRGRTFTPADNASSPRVVVVDQSMARTLWPGRDPLGQCLRINKEAAPCSSVIGISEDAVENSLADSSRLRYYFPVEQHQVSRGGFALLLHMRGDAASQVEFVRRTLQREMPGQYYVTVETLQGIVDVARRSWHFGATMFVAFGVLALLVAAIGLYALIAYNVAQRSHELGVRVALGAQVRHLVRLVMTQGIAYALVGIVVGSLLALAGAHWIQPLLFHESARDPGVFLVVAAVLLLVALLACLGPAIRAAAADPNRALRAE